MNGGDDDVKYNKAITKYNLIKVGGVDQIFDGLGKVRKVKPTGMTVIGRLCNQQSPAIIKILNDMYDEAEECTAEHIKYSAILQSKIAHFNNHLVESLLGMWACCTLYDKRNSTGGKNFEKKIDLNDIHGIDYAFDLGTMLGDYSEGGLGFRLYDKKKLTNPAAYLFICPLIYGGDSLGTWNPADIRTPFLIAGLSDTGNSGELVCTRDISLADCGKLDKLGQVFRDLIKQRFN